MFTDKKTSMTLILKKIKNKKSSDSGNKNPIHSIRAYLEIIKFSLSLTKIQTHNYLIPLKKKIST